MFRSSAWPPGLPGLRPTASYRVRVATKPPNPLLFTRRRQQRSSSQQAQTTSENDTSQLHNREFVHDGERLVADPPVGPEEEASVSRTMIDHDLPAALHDINRSPTGASLDFRTKARKASPLWQFEGPKFVKFRPKNVKWRRLPLKHDTVDLGTAALGKPATIRIMRELRPKIVPEEVRVVQGPVPGAEELESLALATPKTDASPKEVDTLVKKFKEEFLALQPSEGAFTRKQCVEVSKVLYDSLTYEQLASHLKRHEHAQDSIDIHDLEHFYRRSKLITRARWFSGSSHFPSMAIERLDRKNRSRSEPISITTQQPKKLRDLSGKERLVERILRLWGIREQEEAQFGEFDLRLHNQLHLQILLKHSNGIFQKLSEQLGVRIEISEAENIIRIAGPYSLTADAFSILFQYIDRINMSEMRIDEGSASRSDTLADSVWHTISSREYLDQVELLTQTKIQPNEKGPESAVRTLEIYYLGPDRVDLDDAQRLIAQGMEQKDLSKTQVQCDRSTDSGTLVEVLVEPGGVLHMKERHTRWMRWRYREIFKSQTDFIEEITSDKLIYDPTSSREIADKAAQHLFMAWRDSDTPADTSSPYWLSHGEQQLSAKVGLLAHPRNMGNGANLGDNASRRSNATKTEEHKLIESAFQSSLESPRNLLSGVPDLWARLNSVVTSTPQSKHQLLIRLKPGRAGSVSKENLRLLPEMELTFDINELERSSLLGSVRLVRTWRESDLLLPAQAADLRFEARSLICPANQLDPRILEFTKQSKLDVFGDGRLQTPARMELSVPRFACEHWPIPDPRQGSYAERVQDSATYPNEMMVDYFFAMLEHRSSVTATYQGHPFTFSTIEAGRMGGRRDELRFDLPDLEIANLNETDVAAQQLYRDWFNIVREFNARLFR